MIQAGLVKEGMACVKAIRDRYDGERRNPWNEFECGNHYARSMATYSLLNTFSGFTFDMTRGRIGFRPLRTRKGSFRCFWSLDSGWGEFELTPRAAEIRVLSGRLRLREVELPFTPRAVRAAGRAVAFSPTKNGAAFRAVTIPAGKAIEFRCT
jgi:hypothetical protein